MGELRKELNWVWPRIEVDKCTDSTNWVIRPICQKDVNQVVQLFREYYPELSGSEREHFLEESFFNSDVALLDSWEESCREKLWFVGVLQEVESRKIFGAFSFRKGKYDRIVQGTAMVIETSRRNKSFFAGVYDYWYTMIPAMPLEYYFTEVSTRHVYAQKIAVRLGLKMGGLMPGAIRRSKSENSFYRDTLIYMYRYFNGAEQRATLPENANILPELIEESGLVQVLNSKAIFEQTGG